MRQQGKSLRQSHEAEAERRAIRARNEILVQQHKMQNRKSPVPIVIALMLLFMLTQDTIGRSLLVGPPMMEPSPQLGSQLVTGTVEE